MAYRYGRTRGCSPPTKIPARQRILDAAIKLYGEHGFSGVTLKQIAEQAGVSTPLVLHHFESKAGLRTACDQEAAAKVYDSKVMAVEMGEQFSFETMLRQSDQNRSLLHYLTHALLAGGEEVDALMDQLVEDAVAYTAEAVEQGLVKPAIDEHRRAALLLLHGFGSMMLHRQMQRLLGAGPLTNPPEEWGPYLTTLFDVYTNGVFEPDAYQELVQDLPRESLPRKKDPR